MNIVIEPALQEYMRKKKKSVIAVEVAQSNNSDFEVTELFYHLIGEKQAAYYKEKKHFRSVKIPEGEVLLPNYRLEYADTVTFSLKKFWIFHSIRQTGIDL